MATIAPNTNTESRTKSEQDHESTIQSLERRITDSQDRLKWWNRAYVGCMIATALFGLGTIATQQGAIKKAESIARLTDGRDKAKDELADLQRQDFDNDLKSKDQAIAGLKKDTELLERQNLELEAAISPRRLTDKQQKALASLGIFSSRLVEVKSYTGDTEGLILGSQIIRSLKLSHISILDQRTTLLPSGNVHFGVAISGSNNELVGALKSILSEFVSSEGVDISQNLGFSASVQFNRLTPATPPAATILIGPKPTK